MMDYMHGGGHRIERLFVEEAGNLAITIHDGDVLVWSGFDIGDGCNIHKEVEVPDALVEKALELVRAKQELNALMPLAKKCFA